jgi:hypothetical protein
MLYKRWGEQNQQVRRVWFLKRESRILVQAEVDQPLSGVATVLDPPDLEQQWLLFSHDSIALQF